MNKKIIINYLNVSLFLVAILNLLIIPVYILLKDQLLELNISINNILLISWSMTFSITIFLMIIIRLLEREEKKKRD
ncbi:MAG: hypothetical protein ACTSUN_02605 [Promethearchaeota archaeon]